MKNMEWEPKCNGAHDWATSGGKAPRHFCYVCKRCGWWGWFTHWFDCNEIRSRLNFYSLPFLNRFGRWDSFQAPLPEMKRHRYQPDYDYRADQLI